jgi:hypothetical protein
VARPDEKKRSGRTSAVKFSPPECLVKMWRQSKIATKEKRD